MDPLHRLLAINAASGALLGAIFVASLLWLDIAHLRSMMLKDAEGMVALGLLLGGFIVTCASLMMGSALMTGLRRDEEPGNGGGALQPVKVAAVRRTISR